MRVCRCAHPEAAHVGPEGPCRMNKCGCGQFVAVDAPPKAASRQVTFEIPDGYALVVELTPVVRDGS